MFKNLALQYSILISYYIFPFNFTSRIHSHPAPAPINMQSFFFFLFFGMLPWTTPIKPHGNPLTFSSFSKWNLPPSELRFTAVSRLSLQQCSHRSCSVWVSTRFVWRRGMIFNSWTVKQPTTDCPTLAPTDAQWEKCDRNFHKLIPNYQNLLLGKHKFGVVTFSCFTYRFWTWNEFAVMVE